LEAAQASSKNTPLLCAIYHEAWEMVKLLLKAGSDPNVARRIKKNSREFYALDLAMESKEARCVCALLMAGATKYQCTTAEIESLLSSSLGENWTRYNLQVNNPLSMKRLCRLAIRRRLGRRPDKQVYKLDCLPPALRDYIAMTDLDSISVEPESDE
jgi:ankyrin repeat protein